MRHLTLLLLAVLYLPTAILQAKNINRSEAIKIAEAQLGKPVKEDIGAKRMIGTGVGEQSIYIFNATDGEGFVIVAGNDKLPEILAYSDSGKLNIEEAPANLKWILDCYQIIASNNSDTAISKIMEIQPDIAPLLYTQWGQGAPYNSLCPLVNGERCVTGCVATALAQVVNYHRWPQEATAAIDGYITTTNQISMRELQPQKFDWDNMTNEEISKLMLYCGQSVEMDYGLNASGASEALSAKALKDVFGFSASTSFIYRTGYEDDVWEKLIYNELKQQQPVFYSGSSPEGGHAFVVDGYSKGKYHVDWGWEGLSNGYFTLTGLNGFEFGQGALVNACPPGTVNDNRPSLAITSIECQDRILEREANGNFPSFNVYGNLNVEVNESCLIDYALALYDCNSLLSIFADNTKEFQPGEEYSFEGSVQLGNLTEGEYRIVSVCRRNASEEWKQTFGATLYYISISVEGDQLKLQPMPRSEEDLNYIDYGYHIIDGIKYHLYTKYLNNRADVDVLYGYDHFIGDVYIPDYVMYKNMKYDVYWNCNRDEKWELGYRGYPEMTSISIGNVSIGSISDCPKLTSIEIREGGTNCPMIGNCPQLESITYPSSISFIEDLSGCESLKSITVKSEKPVKIRNLGNQWVLPALTDIYFYSDKPHTKHIPGWITDTPYFAPNPNVKIHIPQNSLVSYSKSAWKDWNLIEDLPERPIQVEYDYCGKDTYYTDEHGTSSGIAIGMGDNDVEFAIRIPQDCINAYKNCKLTAIEFYVGCIADNGYPIENDEYVFVTSPGVDYHIKQTANTLRGGWTRVNLIDPYVITGDELFVGVGRHGNFDMNWANLDVEEDGFWLRHMGNDPFAGESGVWKKNAGIKDWNHPLPIRAIIEGESLPMDIAIRKLGISETNEDEPTLKPELHKVSTEITQNSEILKSRYFKCNIDSNGFLSPVTNKSTSNKTKDVSDCKKMRLKLFNRSPKNASSIELGIKVDNKELTSFVYDEGLMRNYETIVEIDLPQNIEGRNHDVEIQINSIDGEKDIIDANSKIIDNFSTKSPLTFPRKIVLEEATGTWCGYCPIGMVAIDQLKTKYPDNFIALSIHNDNDMPVSENFEPFFNSISAYPSFIFNRQNLVEPSDFKIEDLLYSAEATVESVANFESGSNNSIINITTSTSFGFNDEGAGKYKLAYVLVEDKVGPFFQNNFYSDPSAPDDPNDDLNWWKHQKSVVEISFDDVVREIYDDYYGISNSIPDDVKIGETYNFSHTIPVSNNVSNASNLRLITFVLDTKTGEILNASVSEINGYEEPVLCETISISGLPAGDIHIGDCFKLTATILPDNTSDKNVSWKSSNESVVSIDKEGYVQAIALGETVITASTADGSNKSAHITVTVLPILAESIIIDLVESNIKIGDTLQLSATVYPDNTTEKKVAWSSSNNAVATVSSTGLVKAIAIGEVTITATAADGSGMTATAIVRVHPILVENIEIVGLPEGENSVGDKFRLNAIVKPDQATDKSVTWSCDDETVATIDQDGNVEILAEGTTIITATANDESGVYAICIINAISGVRGMIDDRKPITIYDINGRLIRKDADWKYLESLNKGIYIVIQGTSQQKFIR